MPTICRYATRESAIACAYLKRRRARRERRTEAVRGVICVMSAMRWREESAMREARDVERDELPRCARCPFIAEIRLLMPDAALTMRERYCARHVVYAMISTRVVCLSHKRCLLL